MQNDIALATVPIHIDIEDIHISYTMHSAHRWMPYRFHSVHPHRLTNGGCIASRRRQPQTQPMRHTCIVYVHACTKTKLKMARITAAFHAVKLQTMCVYKQINKLYFCTIRNRWQMQTIMAVINNLYGPQIILTLQT